MKKLHFSYASAVAIILLLVTLSQIAIQITLLKETQTRDLATLMNRQELRTQRILRVSLMLVATNPMDKSINPLGINPAQQLQDDLTFTRQTQTVLSGDDVPVSDQMKAMQNEYEAMSTAGYEILTDHKRNDRAAVVAQLTPMFLHEQKYLQGTYNAGLDLTQQADDLVNRVRWLELAIYVITILIVAYEVFGIVLPAERERKEEIAELRSEILKLQQIAWEKRITADAATLPEPVKREDEKPATESKPVKVEEATPEQQEGKNV